MTAEVLYAEVLYTEAEALIQDIENEKESLRSNRVRAFIAKIRQVDSIQRFIWLLLLNNSPVKKELLRFFFRDDLLYKCPILRSSVENVICYYNLTGDREAVSVIMDSRRRIESNFFYELGRRCDDISIGSFEGKLTQENLKCALAGVTSVQSLCTLNQRKTTFDFLIRLGIDAETIRNQCDIFENELNLYKQEDVYADRCFLSYIQELYPKSNYTQEEDPHSLL